MSRITTTVVTLLLTTAAFGQAKDDAGEGKKLDKQTMEIKDYLPEIHGTIRGKYEYQTETGESRFEVRNARFSVSGNVHPLVAYKAEIDLSDEGSIKMLDAYARVFPVKDLNFTIGQMRVPFTIDAHRSPHQQYFANRSFINNKRRLLPDMSPEYVNGLIENNIVNVFRKTDAYKDYPYDNSRGVEFDFENLREIAKNC